MSMNTFQQYLSYGISVIPCRDKKPLLPEWKQYQTKRANGEAAGWAGQVACICGKVSGGLACMDFDVKNGNQWDNWIQIINEKYPELLSKLVIEETPSGGKHVVFRSSLPIRNKKLCRNKGHVEASIETRGEGGYFVCAPSENYSLYFSDFSKIQTLSNEETEILLSTAASLNEVFEEAPEPKQKPEPLKTVSGLSPFDDYNQRHDITGLLQSHGWKLLFQRNDAFYYQRPGKEGRGISATWNAIHERFYVFSTSTVFENEHIYKASAVYAMLKHGGDYSAAAKALYALGYGERLKAIETTGSVGISGNDTPGAAISPEAIRSLVYAPCWDNLPPDTPAILTLADTKILSPGNLCLIIAGNGTGKSAISEVVCTAVINPEADTFNFKVNSTGLVFYVDTERSKGDHARSWLRTMNRASIKTGTIPENLRFELISTLPNVEARREYLSKIVELPNLSILLLDGLGDFVPDVNDAETSNSFLFWLLSEAKQKNFGIFATIHPNPNDKEKKGRGHLGSEAMRRAESVLSIARDHETEIRTLGMNFTHGKNRNDADNTEVSFCWDDTVGMFISCTAPIAPKGKTVRERQDILTIMSKKPEWVYSELCAVIMEGIGKRKRTAEGKIKDLVALEKIVKNEAGLYSVVEKPRPVLPGVFS